MSTSDLHVLNKPFTITPRRLSSGRGGLVRFCLSFAFILLCNNICCFYEGFYLQSLGDDSRVIFLSLLLNFFLMHHHIIKNSKIKTRHAQIPCCLMLLKRAVPWAISARTGLQITSTTQSEYCFQQQILAVSTWVKRAATLMTLVESTGTKKGITGQPTNVRSKLR